mgnify:CR=1 FL=1
MYALMANQREHEDYPEGLTPFKEYPVSEVSHGYDNDFAGKITLDNGESFYFVSHSLQGFIVKRVYVENPCEDDLVLRKWGAHEEYQYFRSADHRLRNWLGSKMDRYCFGDIRPVVQVKITHRLLAFEPMRSKIARSKISVYQSQKDRDNDRQVAMKPGRAFTLIFPELDHKDIISLVDEFLQEFAPRDLTLKTGRDADTFVKAYSWDHSPRENIDTTCYRKSSAASCMRYDFDHLDAHPVSAYASGDFEMVYTTDREGRIASRCVVWVNSGGKEHPSPEAGPIYGVSEQSIDMIAEHLSRLGATFAQDANWEGARLKAIPYSSYGEEGRYIAPYLDLMPQSLTADGKYLIVDGCGEICASDYEGILGNGYNCTLCECSMSEDERYMSQTTEEDYCESCYYERHFHCEYVMEDIHVEDGIRGWTSHRWGPEENWVSQEGLDNYFLYCDSDDEWWHEDDVVWCEDEDEWISPRRIDRYFTSDWDGCLYPLSQACETVDGDSVGRDELDEDWELNSDNLWEKKQEEMDI